MLTLVLIFTLGLLVQGLKIVFQYFTSYQEEEYNNALNISDVEPNPSAYSESHSTLAGKFNFMYNVVQKEGIGEVRSKAQFDPPHQP